MKKNRVEWLSIASNLAVLAGIFLVVIEMRQNQTLVRAELASEAYAIRIDTNNKLIGETPEVVLAKACLHHEDLTPEDRLILKRIVGSKLMLPLRGSIIDGIADLGVDWRPTLQVAFREIFSIQFGREYYAANPELFSEEFRAIGDAILADTSAISCADPYSQFKL